MNVQGTKAISGTLNYFIHRGARLLIYIVQYEMSHFPHFLPTGRNKLDGLREIDFRQIPPLHAECGIIHAYLLYLVNVS